MATQQRDGVEVVDGDQPLADGEMDLTTEVVGAIDDAASDENIESGYQTALGNRSTPTNDGDATGAAAAAGGGSASGDRQQQQPRTAVEPARLGKFTEKDIEDRFTSLEGLRKTAETLAGTLGNLQQRIQAKPRVLSIADLPKVVDNFGEDFAQAMVDDLNAVGFGGPAGGVSQEEINSLVSQQMAQQGEALEQRVEQKIEYKAVKRRHPDADDYFVRPGPDGKPQAGKNCEPFFKWIGSLPANEQEQIKSSWDRDVVSSFLDRFKKLGGGTDTTHQQQVRSLSERRASRLKAAEAPRTSGATSRPVTTDPVEEGYWAAKGGRK